MKFRYQWRSNFFPDPSPAPHQITAITGTNPAVVIHRRINVEFSPVIERISCHHQLNNLHPVKNVYVTL